MRATVLALSLLVGCTNAQPPAERTPGAIAPEGEVVFTINDSIEVHQNMWDAVLERIPPEQRSRMEDAPGGLKRLEEQMAMSQLLYQKALDAGIHKEPTASAGLAMSERDYLAAIYVQREGEKAVTDEAISKRYEERKVQYARPQVKARHILVKEESKAEELKAQLDKGADFAQLAKENSTDPGSKDKGGDLGWFERRRMDPAFAEAAFEAEKGTVVGPVSTRFGFHIIEVQDKRDSVPLEEVKDEIAGSLRQEAIQAMLSTMQAELKVKRPGEPDEAAAPEGDKPQAVPTAIRQKPSPNDPPKTANPKVKAKPANGEHGKDDGHGH